MAAVEVELVEPVELVAADDDEPMRPAASSAARAHAASSSAVAGGAATLMPSSDGARGGVGALAASQIILLAHQDELRHFAPEQQERLAMAIAERAVDNSTINKDICGDCIDQVLVSFDLISFPVAH